MLKATARPYRGPHRYAGLLTCGDCGSTFITINRRWNGKRYAAYVCSGYMHHGKAYCPSHSIREAEPDAKVQQYAINLREEIITKLKQLRAVIQTWNKQKPDVQKQIRQLKDEIQQQKDEIEEILMEKVHIHTAGT